MRNAILSTLVLFCTFQAISQSNVGFKTSIGLIPHRPESVYAGNDQDYVTHEITFADASPVISAGLYGKKVMGWSYFQMDAMYSCYSLDYDLTSFGSRQSTLTRVTEKFKNVDLIINAGITSNNIRMGFGPIFHILADHTSAFDDIPNYNEKLVKTSIGFSGAVGYDIGNLAIDFRYENALTSIGDHIFFGAAKSKFKSGANQITLSVGYGF